MMTKCSKIKASGGRSLVSSPFIVFIHLGSSQLWLFQCINIM